MLKYLQAFIPFMNGLHQSLFQDAKKCLDETSEDVFLIKIKEKSIELLTKKEKKQSLKKQLM
ncbi:MAG: hypothetical protein MJ252_18625 [archaeon]|nr:hypothetical protein [archaeon]